MMPDRIQQPKSARTERSKKWRRRTSLFVAFAPFAAGVYVAHAQAIPHDAKPVSAVPSATFASWFVSGVPTPNGAVKPANSVTFPALNNNSFYQWSWQMFLWLLSPAPNSYGGGAHVFDSRVFYDISTPDSQGKRTFQPHLPGRFLPFPVRAAKVGPHRFPVVMSKAGKLLEIQPPTKSPLGALQLLSGAGVRTGISKVVLRSGKPVFLDPFGKPIAHPRASVLPQIGNVKVVQKFFAGKKPIFLDGFGNVVDTEEGQADYSVLMTRNGSLVYYTIVTNDVYAYFLTGAATGGITPKPTQFPTTATDLAKIKTFASSKGAALPDAEALAIEVKMSWVEAKSLPNPNAYLTIVTKVPVYNQSPTVWKPAGTFRTTTLALVGVHVVGSAAGHPEMIWSTFEHFGNSPNAAYQYIAANGNTRFVPQNTAGSWTLCPANFSGPFNQVHMQLNPPSPNIFAVSPYSVSPSPTIRVKPWGVDAVLPPNQEVSTPAASNTQIISINASVLGQLKPGDMRANYFFVGSTWTFHGVPPNRAYPDVVSGVHGNVIGTSMLANSTMETYEQGDLVRATTPIQALTGTNCFSCHNQRPKHDFTDVSHIYGDMKPLP